MVYIFKDGSVVYDGTTLTKEQREQATLVVSSLPQPEHIPGKHPVLNVDKELNKAFYTYEDAPPIELPGVVVPDSTPEQIQSQILMNIELLVMYKELGL